MEAVLGIEKVSVTRFNKIRQLLDNLNKKKKDYELNVVNALWPSKNRNILPEFLDLIKKKYDSLVEPLDYGNSNIAAEKINKHVSQATKDKIKEIITADALGPLTVLVITNAIYFKGMWQF